MLVSGVIEPPALELVNINGDIFYDLIATTDHRPNIGSQTIYISSDRVFSEDDL